MYAIPPDVSGDRGRTRERACLKGCGRIAAVRRRRDRRPPRERGRARRLDTRIRRHQRDDRHGRQAGDLCVLETLVTRRGLWNRPAGRGSIRCDQDTPDLAAVRQSMSDFMDDPGRLRRQKQEDDRQEQGSAAHGAGSLPKGGSERHVCVHRVRLFATCPAAPRFRRWRRTRWQTDCRSDGAKPRCEPGCTPGSTAWPTISGSAAARIAAPLPSGRREVPALDQTSRKSHPAA